MERNLRRALFLPTDDSLTFSSIDEIVPSCANDLPRLIQNNLEYMHECMKGGKKVKKIIGLLFSLGMLFSMVVPSVSQAAVSFTDVPAGHRFYNEINYLAGREIITGFPGGTFRPDTTVNRGQAAIMIGRALGLNGTQRSTTFSDVDSSQVASGFIASAVEKKIISGFPDGTYRPMIR